MVGHRSGPVVWQWWKGVRGAAGSLRGRARGGDGNLNFKLTLLFVQAGATALHIASANGNLVAVKALLEAGAKVRAADKVSNLNC